MSKRQKRLPKEILVYQYDTLTDGSPIYAIAESVSEIPEDIDGQSVGNYTLNRENKFRIIRELK